MAGPPIAGRWGGPWYGGPGVTGPPVDRPAVRPTGITAAYTQAAITARITAARSIIPPTMGRRRCRRCSWRGCHLGRLRGAKLQLLSLALLLLSAVLNNPEAQPSSQTHRRILFRSSLLTMPGI